MKKLITTLFVLICFNTMFSQSDTIVKRNGEKIAVLIKSSNPSSVSFVYPNEETINTESKNVIEKIIYKSGRVEVCSAKTKLEVISGEKDWEKVIITNSQADVEGLTKVGEVSGKSSWGGAAKSLSDKKAREKIKKEAAKLNCPIVLITTYSSDYYGTKINGVTYK